jgi:hypothetical protein
MVVFAEKEIELLVRRDKMKRSALKLLIASTLVVVSVAAGQAYAAIVNVSGPASSAGTAPEIIAPPPHVLDDIVTNTGMQGFDEAQGVVTTAAYNVDDGGVIPAGMLAYSHMIFLNSEKSKSLSHFQVDWTFSGVIVGVMSDRRGDLEAASTFEFAAAGTNYTDTFKGSGPAAPFNNRGLEAQGDGGGVTDGYVLLGPSTLRVDMRVSEPGDWIRVITADRPVPVDIDIKPGSCPNPLNIKNKGLLPVAILGSADFDVTTIDPDSIRLEGVEPVRSSYEDVATPVSDSQDECACTTQGADGYLDLTLKFDAQEIVDALGEAADRASLPLKLTGMDAQGRRIEGTDCVVVMITGPTLERVLLLTEDFEGVTLGPNVEEGGAGTVQEAWTDTPPDGWTVDESGVPGIGDPDVDGITEWAGWAFADKEFWISTHYQRRQEFDLGQGVVAVADGDEWDDGPHPPEYDPAIDAYDTWLSTPAIDISDIEAGTLQLKFDSSWRPEYDNNYHQTANITASFDGAAPIEVLLWESDSSSPNYKPDDSTNETIIVGIDNPRRAATVVLTFGYFEAGNDWWWAIDNVEVSGLAK